jgi:hypothetical protein
MPTCTDNIVWRSPTRDRARTASRRSSAARTTSESDRGRGQRAERAQHRTCVVEAVRAADRPEELPSQVQGAGGRRRSARSVGAFDAASCASLLVELDVHPRVAMQILRPHALPTAIMGVGLGSAQPTSETDLPIRRSQRNLRECPWMNARARLTYGRSLKDGSARPRWCQDLCLSEPSGRRRLPRRSLSIGPVERRDLSPLCTGSRCCSAPRVPLAPCLQRGSVDVGAAPERLPGHRWTTVNSPLPYCRFGERCRSAVRRWISSVAWTRNTSM